MRKKMKEKLFKNALNVTRFKTLRWYPQNTESNPNLCWSSLTLQINRTKGLTFSKGFKR